MIEEDEARDARQAAALREIFDRIDAREFKVLLKAEAFTDLESAVHEYWKLARSVARQNSAIVSESRSAAIAQLREVVHFDTPDARLYANGYVLRKRAPYVHGRPGAHFELVLEFRSPDVLRAARADVRSAPQYEGAEGFKEELVLVADPSGGFRSLFSHGCRLKEHSWDLGRRFSDVTRIFPGISDLEVLPTAAIKPVGDTAIEEVLFRLGSIDFGGRPAQVTMTVWRDAQTRQVLTGEFAFETQLHRHGRLQPQPNLRSERFYRALQKETGAWVEPGTTKTVLLYRLAGKKVQDVG